MRFSYRAIDRGKYISGQVEAISVRDVSDYLRKNALIPVQIEESRSWVSSLLPQLNSVSHDEVVNFTRQFAIMLNAGLTISAAFDILIVQSNSDALRDLYTSINTSIRAGDSFSKALSKNPQVFNGLYISLIKAGEASGKLNEIMSQMADDLEKQREYNAKIRGTMVYPIIIVLGVIGVLFVLLTFVVPQLSGLYADMSLELPLQTRLLIAASNGLIRWWPVIFAAALCAVFLLRKWIQQPNNRYVLDRIIIKVPKFGEILVIASLVGTTRTLALLIQSGVLVLESINIVINSTDNLVFQRALRTIYRNVQNGSTLSDTFAKEEVFPPILVQMIAVGERTGKLDEVLRKISHFFEVQSDIATKAITTLIEPLMLVLLGGIVLMVVMAVITPIYSLTTAIGGQ